MDIRGNEATDAEQFTEHFSADEPGWQTRVMENFTGFNTGAGLKPGDKDLVDDGWTDLFRRIMSAMSKVDPKEVAKNPALRMQAFEDADNEKMCDAAAALLLLLLLLLLLVMLLLVRVFVLLLVLMVLSRPLLLQE